MFDWQSPESQVVSHKFWIYWAISVPLAILLITLWLLWWKWQKNKYDQNYRSAALPKPQVNATHGVKDKHL